MKTWGKIWLERAFFNKPDMNLVGTGALVSATDVRHPAGDAAVQGLDLHGSELRVSKPRGVICRRLPLLSALCGGLSSRASGRPIIANLWAKTRANIWLDQVFFGGPGIAEATALGVQGREVDGGFALPCGLAGVGAADRCSCLLYTSDAADE